MSAGEVFGINIGSCNATIAINRNGRCEVLASESGEREIPAMVTYQRGAKMVGVSAKEALYRNIRNTAVAMSTLLDANFTDSSIKELIDSLNCTVIQREGGELCYELVYQDGGNVIVPVKEALGEVFQQLAATARLSTSVSPIPCVIAVPQAYGDLQKKSLKACAESVGFKVLLVGPHPPLALLPYGLDTTQDSGHVLVYDMGMRTITVTVVNYGAGLFRTIVSKVINGEGGVSFDKAILSILKEECQRKFRCDITTNQRSLYKLLSTAESTKHSLTTVDTSSVFIESVYDGMDLQCNVASCISPSLLEINAAEHVRARFEGVCQGVFQSCARTIHQVLSSVSLTAADINKVLLIGGGCKVPRVVSLLAETFPNSTILSTIPCEHVVAMGAAMQCLISHTHQAIELPINNRGIPCISSNIWITCDRCSDPVATLLLAKGTPLPCSKTASLCPEPDKMCDHVLLQLRDGDGSSTSTVVAEVKVPSATQVLDIHVELIWNSSDISDQVISLNVTEKTSNWSTSLSLTTN